MHNQVAAVDHQVTPRQQEEAARRAQHAKAALGLAIDKSNCIMVRVAGTNHFVRTNKLEARGLNSLMSGAITWRAEAGYLYLG